jgi:transposase-like protein
MSQRRSLPLADYAAMADQGGVKCPRCHWERCWLIVRRPEQVKYECRQCGAKFWRNLPKERDGN